VKLSVQVQLVVFLISLSFYFVQRGNACAIRSVGLSKERQQGHLCQIKKFETSNL
jgi:hypothetical protein